MGTRMGIPRRNEESLAKRGEPERKKRRRRKPTKQRRREG